MDSKGRTWLPDQYFVTSGDDDGLPVTTNSPIAETLDDGLFQTARRSKEWNKLKYEIPVPNGEYEVVLYMAEIVYV